MNLSIVLTDFIDNTGVLRTYRFVPVNPYNKVVVDRIEDIYRRKRKYRQRHGQGKDL